VPRVTTSRHDELTPNHLNINELTPNHLDINELTPNHLDINEDLLISVEK
jgi:hypothetical protein